MTKIASVVVATVFTWLRSVMSAFYSQGGAYTRDKTTYAGIELKMQEGGGVIVGFYGNIIIKVHHTCIFSVFISIEQKCIG